jgi:hypothetical protein
MTTKKSKIQVVYITYFKVLREQQGGTELEMKLLEDLEFKIC